MDAIHSSGHASHAAMQTNAPSPRCYQWSGLHLNHCETILAEGSVWLKLDLANVPMREDGSLSVPGRRKFFEARSASSLAKDFESSLIPCYRFSHKTRG
jgi:hypothetical protein